MLRRKTPQADLENKRSTWRALGFVASLSLILSALAWTSYDVAITLEQCSTPNAMGWNF